MSGILADRYASKEMREIWSKEQKILLERELWIAIMRVQRNLGFSIEDDVVASYEQVKNKIDITSINAREKILKHDVKARIEEFNALSGHQSIHIGMTSRDLTENIELFQMRKSLKLVEFKSLAFLQKLGVAINSYINLPIVARTHNVPAQMTTLGRRFATWAEELIFSIEHLQNLVDRLPLRGIKGAVGTQQDAIDLIGAQTSVLDGEIARLFGFENVAKASSQIYPRSYDYEVLTCLVQVSAAATNMSTNIRLMSGHGLINEGFKRNQVGSSAMPHKVNSRSSERINALGVILKGYSTMVSEVSGNQWNEGDVSCSVVRRVALPDAFFTIDAILDTSMDVIQNLVVNERVIRKELEANLPFVLSSKILMKSLENGIGREEAHAAIRKHALSASINLSDKGVNNFFDLIAQDSSLGVNEEYLQNLLTNPLQHSGNAQTQARDIFSRIVTLCGNSKEIPAYIPEEPI
jgi:adenylosuccinate lyase